MDLTQILKKLEEIDRLKMILLNSDQLLLFDSLSKKYLFEENGAFQENWKYSLKKKKIENNEEREVILNYIENVKNDRDASDLEKRLVDLYEENLFLVLLR